MHCSERNDMQHVTWAAWGPQREQPAARHGYKRSIIRMRSDSPLRVFAQHRFTKLGPLWQGFGVADFFVCQVEVSLEVAHGCLGGAVQRLHDGIVDINVALCPCECPQGNPSLELAAVAVHKSRERYMRAAWLVRSVPPAAAQGHEAQLVIR